MTIAALHKPCSAHHIVPPLHVPPPGRSRTLLHFVAREVARQHADGASLQATLPSAAAATQLDLEAAKAEVAELTAGARWH